MEPSGGLYALGGKGYSTFDENQTLSPIQKLGAENHMLQLNI